MTETATATTDDNGSTSAALTTSAVDPSTATTGTVTEQTTTTQVATGVDWLPNADEATTGYLQNKGWKSPTELLSSYQNLEKLFGADKAGNTVVLPKENSTPEELANFYNKLGRPSDAAGYKIPVPEKGGDPEFAKVAAGKFHELGLSKAQGEKLAEWYNGMAASSLAARETQTAQTFQSDEAALRVGWGAAYDQNKVAAQNAVAALGLDAGTIDKLQGSLGHKGTMELLAKIGAKSTEGSFVTGDTSNGFGNVQTPAQAKDNIKALMADKDFTAKYIKGDTDAVAKMKLLHSYAYPEDK